MSPALCELPRVKVVVQTREAGEERGGRHPEVLQISLDRRIVEDATNETQDESRQYNEEADTQQEIPRFHRSAGLHCHHGRDHGQTGMQQLGANLPPTRALTIQNGIVLPGEGIPALTVTRTPSPRAAYPHRISTSPGGGSTRAGANRKGCCDRACLGGYFSNSSAIWTALRAAPLSSWSPETQKQRPLSKAQSRRRRPTAQLSFSAVNRGMG